MLHERLQHYSNPYRCSQQCSMMKFGGIAKAMMLMEIISYPKPPFDGLAFDELATMIKGIDLPRCPFQQGRSIAFRIADRNRKLGG